MIKGISEEKIVERSENSIVFDVFIDSSCDYFEGHFPSFKLLPAVAEFTLAAKFARKYFSVPRFVSSIPRMKFSSPLLPETNVRFSLKYDAEKQKISFSLSDAQSDKKFSSGFFSLSRE